MTEAEVLLPALSDEENNVVEHFLEASTELMPSVQVSLAKRILRPGSSKVLCMAARTSVPLNDDEQASVSDLALRLSDGTNVKLTLSFFNDGDSEALAPSLKRLNYAPEHYETVRNDPNFGQVIFATCLIAITSFYYMAKSPGGMQAGLSNAAKPAIVTHHSTVSLGLPVAPKASATVKTQTHEAAAPASTPKSTLKKKSPVAAQSRDHSERALKSVHQHNDAFFVPPPPPITYSYPVQPMPFMPAMAPGSMYMPTPTAQNRPAQVNVARAKNAPMAAPATAKETTAAKTSLEVNSIAPDLLPSPAPSQPEKYSARKVTSQTSIHKSLEAEAPSPGFDKGYPPLERIVAPVGN